jgi:hypothetical protein
MEPTVDMMPYIINQVLLYGDPDTGIEVPESIVLPKPSGPMVARAQINKTKKNVKVTVLAK